MNVEIIPASEDNIHIADLYLTKLIHDEKKYDKNINDECNIVKYYENIYPSNDNLILFAQVDNLYVGYLYGYIENNGDTYLKSIAKLDAMYVDEEYRSSGIGGKLIDEFDKWTKEKSVSCIELSVCRKNSTALDLYESKGFIKIKYIMIKEEENEKE